MALPQLTEDQRAANLAKAAAARTARTELKKRLSTREINLDAVFKLVDDGDEVAKKTKVVDLVKALPGIGQVKAAEVMGRLEIPDNRRAGGLGARQRQALITEFSA